MSNTDFDPSYLPDPTSYLAQAQRSAIGDVATSGEANPDDAARAIDVANATGIPSPVVHDDLDHYEAQLKSKLSTDIVANNPDLQDYINSHPLAAKVSNDDWGALDKASGSIKALNLTTVPGVDTVLPMGPNPSLEELAHNFKAGFGDEPLGAWGAQTEKSREFIRQYPYSATLAGLEGLGFELPARIMGGLASAVFGPEKAQALMDPGLYASLQGLGPEGAVMEGVGVAFAGLLRAAHAGRPWLEAGKVPPVGIDPLLDQAHALQAKADAEKLKEALKDSAATATLERSPELFADHFVRQITDGEVGIPAEVARKNEAALSKIIPDFETKLANAGEGDVMLTAGQYLSNPDVMKDLVDDTRVRKDGLTPNEAKDLPPIEAYHGSPYEFDAFDMGKIGTGEGAQSYGHGLYFAEAPEVAKSYAPDQGQLPEGEIDYSKPPQSSLYRVHIHANKEDFLDWDKDLSEQPGILAKITPELREELEDMLDEGGQSADLDVHGGRHLYQLLEKKWEDSQAASEHLQKLGIPGIKYLDQGSRDHATIVTDLEEAKKESESATGLRKNEVDRQIQILERMAAKAPTSNFVLFDPSLVEITHKNGEAVRALRQAAKLEPVAPKAAARQREPIPEADYLTAEQLRTPGMAGNDFSGIADKLDALEAMREKPTTKAKQLELPVEGTTRIADTPPFEGAAPGLTKKQTQKYGQLIAKRVAEDQAYLQQLEEAKEAKRQSKAFKERKIELQPEVEQAYAARPDVALEAKLREGNLSLDPASLTEAQRAAVPKEWLREGGATPQDLAYAFGTSPDILDRTLALKAQRDAAGMRPGDFDRRMIAAEVDRRAQAEISGPTIEEIKDHVISQTQEEMLHEQTLALAEAAGEKYPIKSAALKEQVIEAVRAEGYKAATRDKYLAEAGRAGRKLEDPALQGNPAEQFRLSQAQEIAFMKARYAKQVEKAVAKVEKLAARYSKREVDKRLPEYVNAIHSILAKLGEPIGRRPEDLAKEMAAGVYKDLNDFIAKKQNEYEVAGIEFPVADFLLDPDFKKPLKDFTAGEMEGLAQSLTTLDHRGRVEDQVIREGKVFDRKALIKDMNQQLADKFGIEAPTLKDKSLPKRFLRQFWAGLHAIETVFGRFDGRDPEGIFTRTFTYPGARALNDENVIQRELSGKYRALGEVKKPNEVLEHPFVDQLNGTPRRITRANLDNIIANIGNKYNRERMAYTLGLYSRDAKGKIVFDTDSLMKWVESVATPEEITRAQRRGDEVWSWLKGKDDNVYRQIYGVAPEDIPLDGFSMHGKDYDGWYHPIIADDERAVKAGHRDQDRVTKPTSFWPSTRNSFTKRRTGNIERLSIEPGRAELVMSQMVHDIALREYVDEISKIVNDDQFRLGITRSYGKEYHDVVKQWLWNVAGNASYNAGAIDTATKISNFLRQNVISTYIAFNLAGTVLKHGPTALVMSMREGSAGKFLKNSFNTYLSSVANKAGYGEAFMNFLGKDPALGESIWEFVQRYSEEIQRRDRNYMETMSGSHDIVFGKSTLRNRIMQWGAKAVSFSDMLSAVPLWYTKYNEVLGQTGDHYQSVQEADLAVRNAHGSTSEMSRPLIVDHNSALAPWFTSLYGFFGANMQQKIKLMHDLNDIYKLGKAGEIKEAAGMLPGITASTLAYVIAPVVVEEAVTSQFSDDRRGLGHKALSWALLAATNSVLGLRDLSWGLENNQEPSAGLISSPLKDMYTLYQRVTKPNAMSKANAGKLVESFLTTAGDATGMMPKPVARAMRGMIDVYNQQQHPRSTGDWYRLLMHGNTQRHITRR